MEQGKVSGRKRFLKVWLFLLFVVILSIVGKVIYEQYQVESQQAEQEAQPVDLQLEAANLKKPLKVRNQKHNYFVDKNNLKDGQHSKYKDLDSGILRHSPSVLSKIHENNTYPEDQEILDDLFSQVGRKKH